MYECMSATTQRSLKTCTTLLTRNVYVGVMEVD